MSHNNRALEQQLLQILKSFGNFPIRLGHLTVSTFQIEKPAKTGTFFNNHKGFTSIVLLAVCEVRYNFTVADVGQCVSSNGAGVLAPYEILHVFENNIINVPAGERFPGCAEGKLPYFLLDDDIPPPPPLKRGL